MFKLKHYVSAGAIVCAHAVAQFTRESLFTTGADLLGPRCVMFIREYGLLALGALLLAVLGLELFDEVRR